MGILHSLEWNILVNIFFNLCTKQKLNILDLTFLWILFRTMYQMPPKSIFGKQLTTFMVGKGNMQVHQDEYLNINWITSLQFFWQYWLNCFLDYFFLHHNHSFKIHIMKCYVPLLPFCLYGVPTAITKFISAWFSRK